MVQEGETAPEFTLTADDGNEVRLSGLRGNRVVLYFYPKDDTPGCTTEACEFRDHLGRFDSEDVLVFGISPDAVESHRKFKEKYGLTFPLLADDDHAVAERYGVWKEKNMYGRKYWGVERTTFLIGEDGVVERVWKRVRPKGHAQSVADALGAGE